MKRIHFFILILLGLGLVSCEEVIDVDTPPNVEKFVIEGAITTETDSSFIRLTKSVPYFENTKTTPLVTDAVVTVNGVLFSYTGNDGIYKAAVPYVGVTGQTYNLLVKHDGKEYTSSSILDPLFTIDTVISVYKEEQGFLEAGYTVKYTATDNRPPVKYTYFRFGYKNEEDTKGLDSLNEFKVLFDNRNSKTPYEFEIPFLRLQPNDTALMIFRSIDETVNRFYQAWNNRENGGGPFSTPPANLPTNIKGPNALGLFAAYDVKRFRTRIVK
ncbi:MAG: DUF4249 domain-containing protein [Bacteroidota bacterium]